MAKKKIISWFDVDTVQNWEREGEIKIDKSGRVFGFAEMIKRMEKKIGRS